MFVYSIEKNFICKFCCVIYNFEYCFCTIIDVVLIILIYSVFWWTNETINIWSHIFGFILFIALTIYDLMILKIEAPLSDKIIVAVILLFFQVSCLNCIYVNFREILKACMALSAIYHTFCCRSEEDCLYFLSFDLFGIALSLYGIYVSGIYYAFWCEPVSGFYRKKNCLN